MDFEGQTSFEFSEKSVRHAFIKKVYAILSVQLIVTFGIVAICTFVEPINEYVRQHSALFWVAFSISLAIMLALGCAGDLRRKTPWNFICLAIFTLSEGVLLGFIAAFSDSKEVAIAIVATIAVTIGLTAFAFQTKIDFTMKSGVLVALTMVMFIFMIFALIFRSSIVYTLYACIGAFLFSLYIVFDTQLLLGGQHKVSVSPEEYIFAALNLYLDIVNLFLMILAISNSTSN